MQHFLAAPSLELSIPVPYAPERPGMFYDLCTGHSLLTWKALPQSPRAQLKLYLLSGILTDPHIPKCTNMLAQRNSFNSVAQSCPSLCNPMNCSTPGLPVHHQVPEFNETHVHWVSDAIRPSHPLLSPSPPAPNPSQHQSLFQWVNSSHEVAKVLEFQL